MRNEDDSTFAIEVRETRSVICRYLVIASNAEEAIDMAKKGQYVDIHDVADEDGYIYVVTNREVLNDISAITHPQIRLGECLR